MAWSHSLCETIMPRRTRMDSPTALSGILPSKSCSTALTRDDLLQSLYSIVNAFQKSELHIFMVSMF